MASDRKGWEAWRSKFDEKTDLTAVEPILDGTQKHELDQEFDLEHGTGGKHAPYFKFNSVAAADAQGAYEAWLVVKDVAFRSLEVLGTVEVQEVLIARSASSREFELVVRREVLAQLTLLSPPPPPPLPASAVTLQAQRVESGAETC